MGLPACLHINLATELKPSYSARKRPIPENVRLLSFEESNKARNDAIGVAGS